jgi:hypothetical protein
LPPTRQYAGASLLLASMHASEDTASTVTRTHERRRGVPAGGSMGTAAQPIDFLPWASSPLGIALVATIAATTPPTTIAAAVTAMTGRRDDQRFPSTRATHPYCPRPRTHRQQVRRARTSRTPAADGAPSEPPSVVKESTAEVARSAAPTEGNR